MLNVKSRDTLSTRMGGPCTDRVGHSMLDHTNMQISEAGLLTLGQQCEGIEWALTSSLNLHAHSIKMQMGTWQ